MKQCVLFLMLLMAVMVSTQRLGATKLGDCPPPFVGTCNKSCGEDVDCPGQAKCCLTSCRGTMCIMPVTMRRSNLRSDKPGLCPAKPAGAWICSNTCSYDTDCRGRLKCCRGRCPGSMICAKPEI